MTHARIRQFHLASEQEVTRVWSQEISWKFLDQLTLLLRLFKVLFDILENCNSCALAFMYTQLHNTNINVIS